MADGYEIDFGHTTVSAQSLVVATGGKSIPKMGATSFGYKLAEQFGLRTIETRPALVPLTFDPDFLTVYGALSGVSLPAIVSCGKQSFAENLLFTHRGLSGPAILQISSFWREGQEIRIDLLPGRDALDLLKAAKTGPGKREAVGVLSEWLPHRLAQAIAADFPGRIGEMKDKTLVQLAERLKGLADQADRFGGLSHRRSHPRWHRHARSRRQDYGSSGSSPASISSANWSTSPAGSAAIISSGPGARAGPPGRWCSGCPVFPPPCGRHVEQDLAC